MNLIVISSQQSGGEWVAISRLLQALKKNRPEGHIYGILKGTYENIPVPQVFDACQILPPVRTTPPLSFLKRWYGEFTLMRNAVRNELARHPQISYAVTTDYLSGLAVTSMRTGRKIFRIYSYHGIKSSLHMAGRDFNYREIVKKFLECLALLMNDVIITPAPEGIRQIKKIIGPFHNPKHIEIIPNIVPIDYFVNAHKSAIGKFRLNNNFPKSKKIILYCGRVAPYKGLEQLIRAYALLLRKRKALQLVIAYPSSGKDERILSFLKQEIISLQISQSVAFLPDLTEANRIILYNIASLTVIPSETEISSLSILESLACGTLSLSSNTGNAREILAPLNPALVIQTITAAEIAKKVDALLRLPQKQLETLTLRGKSVAETFSEVNAATKFMTLIDSLS